MAGDYLLDTNILIAFLADEPGLSGRVESVASASIPFASLAELYYGARKSSHVRENTARVDQLSERFAVLYPDPRTVREYAVVRAGLNAVGRPIPEADLWIATLAIQHRLTLVSRDTHFRGVDRLELQCW